MIQVDISAQALQDVVVLDIETEPISQEMFYRQRKKQYLFNVLPSPRVCVTYDSKTNEHHVYMPDSFDQLYRVVQSRTILTFNGIYFDIPVLLRYLNLEGDPIASKTDHLDLLVEIKKRTRHMHKLDSLSMINLGERKHTNGKQMKDMDIEKLTRACQSDVDQTYALARMFCENTLQYPAVNRMPVWSDTDRSYRESLISRTADTG
jgi:hypothetical protein